MSVVDLIALALVTLTALSGFRRGLVVGVFSLAGLALGAYLGARVGPSLVGAGQARWLPLVALGGAMLCAAVGQAIGVVIGRNLRRGLLVLGPLRVFDNIGGGMLGAVTGLALCWAVGAVLLYVPGQTELRRYAQDSDDSLDAQSGVSTQPPDRCARADRPVRHPRRAGGRCRSTRGRRARLSRCQRCRAQRRSRGRLLPADWASKGPGGWLRPVSSSPTHTSSPESTPHTSTATTASCSTRVSSHSTGSTTSPCFVSPT